MSKYYRFESWMVGHRVIEDGTGDIGTVDCVRTGEYTESVYVNWHTGRQKGERLWISIDSLTFVKDVDISQKKYKVQKKLEEIETLVKEIRTILEGGDE